jgi:crotonobetainyl-CoA:carnitine CoA-transferase CaiB-like acyl-CoA transferase
MRTPIELGEPPTGPLAGVRVLDLTTVYSGPIATLTLADQGADVIKLEAADGDLIRRGRPARNQVSASFASINRNKRGIVVDLRAPAGLAIARRLIERADVLVENFRPGVMDRLGLGWEAARGLNARLVYASVNGVGASGPYARRRVYDAVIQAISGMAAIQSDPAQGTPRMINTLICDKLTSLTAAQAITSALYARERTGSGQRIEVSMLDASIAFLWHDSMAGLSLVGDGIEPGIDLDHAVFVRRTADGFIAAMPVKAAEWEGTFRALDLPNLFEDPRFANLTARLANQADWQAIVNGAFLTFSTDDICERFEREDVPYSRINDRREVLNDPQVAAMGAVIEYDHPVGGRMRQARPAAQFHATPSNVRRASPGLGEHTDEVLRELGCTDAEIAELRAAKAVG